MNYILELLHSAGMNCQPGSELERQIQALIQRILESAKGE